MADFVKNLIMIKVGVEDCTILDILPNEFSSYVEIANMFSLEYLKSAFSRFARVELDLKYSLNPENLFEMTCFELMKTGENVVKAEVPTEIKQTNTIETVNNQNQEQKNLFHCCNNHLPTCPKYVGGYNKKV